MQTMNYSSVIIYAWICVDAKLILNHNCMENTHAFRNQVINTLGYGLAAIGRCQVITWTKIAKIVRIWHYEEWVGKA